MNDTQVRIGVCEASAGLLPGSQAWKRLCNQVRRVNPDIFLLNEMPFGSWLAAGKISDSGRMQESIRLHEEGAVLFPELGAPIVLGTRPVLQKGKFVNEAFVWSAQRGMEGIHTKQYFPDEEGYYEARWFQAGDRHFRVAKAGGLGIGFLICTEVMFNEHARRYGRQGAQLICVPRAVGGGTLARWLVAMRMAAIVSGCYVVSSNRGGTDAAGQHFGGRGWVVDPDGEMVSQSSCVSPVVAYDIDLEFVSRAQQDYPCYVTEPD